MIALTAIQNDPKKVEKKKKNGIQFVYSFKALKQTSCTP